MDYSVDDEDEDLDASTVTPIRSMGTKQNSRWTVTASTNLPRRPSHHSMDAAPRKHPSRYERESDDVVQTKPKRRSSEPPQLPLRRASLIC